MRVEVRRHVTEFEEGHTSHLAKGFEKSDQLIIQKNRMIDFIDAPKDV